ncbi:hypothetical protein XENOCAPTIV_030425 [Xenoophorus captivus]|uniref:Uncharacterized protein n=1 Tax=Xenoophorus captivus TaxID=1517983 RepID=A0ABV0Q6Z9_9TELE
MLEYCPAAQFSEGGDHALFRMSQYMLTFMVPSINCSSPQPTALMQPQSMALPPKCFTVGKTHRSLYSSLDCHHTCLTLAEPNKFALVSLQHRTRFQVFSLPVLCIIFRRYLILG